MNVPNGLAHSLVPVEVFGVAGHRGGQAFAANGLAYGKRSPRTGWPTESCSPRTGGPSVRDGPIPPRKTVRRGPRCCAARSVTIDRLPRHTLPRSA